VSQLRIGKLASAPRCRAGACVALALAALLMAQGARAGGAPPVELAQGCGQPAPAVAPSAVDIGGQRRGLIVSLPPDYRPTEPHALVVAFHGRTSSNATVRRYYDLERHADVPTIFVYPRGLRDGSGGYTWAEPDDPAEGLRDYALFDAVLALVARVYCLDPGRIYAVGHSLGASFVNSLGCARGDVLRGIATLAGGFNRSACRGRVAALILHNPNDRLVAFSYGLRTRDAYRADNGIPGPGRQVSLGGFTCQRYGEAGSADPVLWCPHTRDRTRSGRFYPHNWPRGTGGAMMAFFQSLPAGATAAATLAAPGAPEG
jgi:polyhydroxybutyrate depolymerase